MRANCARGERVEGLSAGSASPQWSNRRFCAAFRTGKPFAARQASQPPSPPRFADGRPCEKKSGNRKEHGGHQVPVQRERQVEQTRSGVNCLAAKNRGEHSAPPHRLRPSLPRLEWLEFLPGGQISAMTCLSPKPLCRDHDGRQERNQEDHPQQGPGASREEPVPGFGVLAQPEERRGRGREDQAEQNQKPRAPPVLTAFFPRHWGALRRRRRTLPRSLAV